jgi:hypothetical protein
VVEGDRRFRGACCLHYQGDERCWQKTHLKRRQTKARLHGAIT